MMIGVYLTDLKFKVSMKSPNHFSLVGKHLFFILIRFLNLVMAVVFGQARPGGLRHLVSSLTWETFTGTPKGAIKERFGRYVMNGNPG